MRPTSREIIESIVAAIDEVILPAVEEKQAASSLRAARTLLDHLAARVEIDADVLAADNVDAAAVLGVAPEPAEGMVALQASNLAYQEAIDRILRALPPPGQEDAEGAATRRRLRKYLGRRHSRERPMIVPAFLGTPF